MTEYKIIQMKSFDHPYACDRRYVGNTMGPASLFLPTSPADAGDGWSNQECLILLVIPPPIRQVIMTFRWSSDRVTPLQGARSLKKKSYFQKLKSPDTTMGSQVFYLPPTFLCH
jgi:hypothetical protein